MNNYKNKKVTIMGLGLYEHGSGIEAAKFFIRLGAKVTITDLKDRAALAPQLKRLDSFIKQRKYKKPKLRLGEHRETDFTEADLIIKNPGVRNTSPYLALAVKNNIPIETDISIFFKLCRAPIVGVTGTRGKSTTSALIYEILKTAWSRAWLGGNILISPLEFCHKIKPEDVVVLELSSWALEMLNTSPHIAVVTNIYPDHLNTYADMNEYISAKKRIFKFQGKEDFLVVNQNNKITKKMKNEAMGQVRFFDSKKTTNANLPGEHNESNVAAAISVAKIFGISEILAQKAIRKFSGLPGRLQMVALKKGIIWYNDTTATSPDATLAALKTLASKEKSIILICGGVDKHLPYTGFGREIALKTKRIILLPGTATEKIKTELTHYIEVDSMSAAVATAKLEARRGDIVLLSPGAASLNIFKNEYDRGDQFVKLVKRI